MFYLEVRHVSERWPLLALATYRNDTRQARPMDHGRSLANVNATTGQVTHCSESTRDCDCAVLSSNALSLIQLQEPDLNAISHLRVSLRRPFQLKRVA